MPDSREDARRWLLTELQRVRNERLSKGKVPTVDQLSRHFARFAQEFGPSALQSLEGRDLLEKMHLHANKDSLVYWLEFKNDDELPNVFGGIGGGSAYKFGIYRRKETGAWVVGNPHDHREVTVAEAADVARRNREELIAGVEALRELPSEASDEDYARLQAELERVAPNIQDGSWARKYFYMMAPEKLDDFHALEYERFYLRQTLQVPPQGPGRYRCSGRYVSLARELGMPTNHLTDALGTRTSRPYSYWLVKVDPSTWPEIRDKGMVGVNDSVPEDLSSLTYVQAAKNRVIEFAAAHLQDGPSRAKKYGQELFHFATLVGENDVFVAAAGDEILALGRVSGGYQWEASSAVPHQLPVDWLDLGEWTYKAKEASNAEFMSRLRNEPLIVEVEARIIQAQIESSVKPPADGRAPERLSGVPAQVERVLARKGQVILYGPPGTGKTHWALLAAHELAARENLARTHSELDAREAEQVFGLPDSYVHMCTFHPAYGYEQFIEGFRPETVDGNLVFTLRPGLFRELCSLAREQPKKSFYLVIDEINRGDIPRIFGELITLLELSKRNLKVRLPLSGEQFEVPPNLRLIGTMNTADRSIALLDTALRRRFGFVELMPDSAVLGPSVVGGIPLAAWLESLNQRVIDHLGTDSRNLQVGHSYLMEDGRPIEDIQRLKRALREDILPLLQEYCYDDWEGLEAILGFGLVDAASRSFREELFELGAEEALAQALLSPDPDLATSGEVVDVVEEEVSDEDEDSPSEP